MDIVSPRPAEVADDELHDRHEVDLSDERLRHRERVTQVAGAEAGIPVIPMEDVERAVADAGVPAGQAEAIADDYGDAQLQALKRAIGAVAIFALLSLWFTRGLPRRPLSGGTGPEGAG